MTGARRRDRVQMLFYYTHTWKNGLLLVLSLITIPLSATLVFISFVVSTVRTHTKQRIQDASKRKTILVTGVSMTKGLSIARSLAQNTPHHILGADVSSLAPGRFSSAISKYFHLEKPHGNNAEPYVTSLLSVISSENVDLWVSCSSVVAAVEDGQVVQRAQEAAREKGRRFEAIQFDDRTVEKFHEKDQFIDHIASLNLTIPESYRCTSADAALNVLLRAFDDNLKDLEATIRPEEQNGNDREKHSNNSLLGKHFILKPIGVDDKARAAMMTLLPRPTRDQTLSHIASLAISPTNPFQLQQFIRGTEYCTHALVVRGAVKAFTCCPSSELLMHYEPLAPDAALSRAMLDFTERVARYGGSGFTGHLSFDFLVPQRIGPRAAKEDEKGDGASVELYPIECNPRAHTAVVLFDRTPEMAAAYMSVFDDDGVDNVFKPKATTYTPVCPRTPTSSYYWLGHDVVTLGILPLLDVFFGQAGWAQVRSSLTQLARHVLFWRDGTWTLEDPVPFFVLYHVYWPARFMEALWAGKTWSRINVSTTKMFEG